jgi:transposase
MRRHEVSEEQWTAIEPLLAGKPGDPGSTGHDNRLFVNAVFWIARTGSPWRDLPERFGPWNSVYRRLYRWCKRGVWGRILEALGGDAELTNLLLDSTIIRAHQHAVQGIGVSAFILISNPPDGLAGVLPRLPRPIDDGFVYHAINQGNNRADVFGEPGDHQAFLEALGRTRERYPLRLFGYCLMTNHFHLLLRPGDGQSISRILQSLTVGRPRKSTK